MRRASQEDQRFPNKFEIVLQSYVIPIILADLVRIRSDARSDQAEDSSVHL